MSGLTFSFGRISPEMRRKWYFRKTVAVRFTHRLDTLDSSIIEREVRHQFFKLGYYHQKIPEKFIIEFSMNLTQGLESQFLEKIISWLTCLLFRKFGDTCRNPSSTEQLVEQAIATKKREDTHQKLIEALKTDPLCGLAWFNYAVYQSQKKRSDIY